MNLILWSADPTPLDPGRDQARDWAREELAKGQYLQARPNAFSRLLEWIFGKVPQISSDGTGVIGPEIGWVLLILLVVIITTVVLLHTGRLRSPTRLREKKVLFSDEVRSATELRTLAQQAANRGDWHNACCDQFRAIIRSLEERTILMKRPGQTAEEAAQHAAAHFPDLRAELFHGARIFADLRYGDRPARAEYFAELQALDRAVTAAQPHFSTQPSGVR